MPVVRYARLVHEFPKLSSRFQIPNTHRPGDSHVLFSPQKSRGKKCKPEFSLEPFRIRQFFFRSVRSPFRPWNLPKKENQGFEMLRRIWPNWNNISPTDRFPWRLTWNIIMEVWKIIFLYKWVICRFHVNLPGCRFPWNSRGPIFLPKSYLLGGPKHVFSVAISFDQKNPYHKEV